MELKSTLKFIPLFTVLLNIATAQTVTLPKPSPDLDHLPPSLKFFKDLQQKPPRPQECKSCADRKSSESKEKLKQLRYGMFKQQILQKLQMSEAPRPKYTSRPALKPLLIAAEMMENATEREQGYEQQAEEAMESVVIYPTEGDFICHDVDTTNPCMQFKFKLPKDVTIDSFSSFELWLHKREPTSLFRLTELVFDSEDQVFQSSLYYELDADADDTWKKYELPSDLLWSRVDNEFILTVQVKCRTGCEVDEPVWTEGDDRPFLIIRTRSPKGPSRNRRSVDCVEGSTSCCRETFYLNFTEISWDNWILYPEGYYANYCRGKCVNDLSTTRYYHTAVLVSYIQDSDTAAAEMDLNMCCTPSLMAPLSIIYMNDDEPDVIYHKSIENMKVEACDCA